jgi:hypothetical protein
MELLVLASLGMSMVSLSVSLHIIHQRRKTLSMLRAVKKR